MKKKLFDDLVESLLEMKAIEKAATTPQPDSDVAGKPLGDSLSEDARDLKTVRQRRCEPDLKSEKVVADLRRSRKL